ncbi:diaminopimelate decarboxylase family protein [Nocardia gipuzkoensis]|uniref:diaminopimelate decarboxylase family protein n=1 Tax=Nocardia gipuzkoensis TaxID=2749991 RepID=UPI00237DEFB4|nr:hypothetical protein [Nocardia gipuzkoensis]MDE1671494.1 hypothetical protein [Nocardia gipuzkoensis]
MVLQTVGEPLVSPPSSRLLNCAEHVATPALIYDLPGINAAVRRMREDIEAIPGAALNLALKACHTPAVLHHFAQLGVGCDVASVGELLLAAMVGFQEISATGPAFSSSDFAIFAEHNVVVDIDSLSQLETYGAQFPGSDVGLRIRVPLPAELESSATFAADSRFGMNPTDPALASLLARHRLRVTRLHTHTGQMTPQSLRYKAKYLFAVAEYFTDVQTVDFGGGFFHLYIDRGRATAAFTEVAAVLSDWERRNERKLNLRFEPGGALLAPFGYLVTEVRAVENEHPFFGCRVVTVDSSAWNLAPWHVPQAVPLRDSNDIPERTLIAGNTLYERDFFGLGVNGRQHEIVLPPQKVGDRILLTAAGAYTMTNARRFNRIAHPSEYLFDGESVVRADKVDRGEFDG